MVDFSKDVSTLNKQEIESELGEIVKDSKSPYWDSGPYSSQRDRYQERAQKLYEARSKTSEEALKGELPENRGFAHELNKTFGDKGGVIKSGEEARAEWEDTRWGEMQSKVLDELKGKWGQDFETNMDYAFLIKDNYLTSDADKEWLETPGPDGVRPGDDPYLIEKMVEIGRHISKKYRRSK